MVFTKAHSFSFASCTVQTRKHTRHSYAGTGGSSLPATSPCRVVASIWPIPARHKATQRLSIIHSPLGVWCGVNPGTTQTLQVPTSAHHHLFILSKSAVFPVIMSFGFSVGDFLAGIKLAHDLAVALSDGRGSKVQFQGLVRELYSLERAMIAIHNLQVPAELEQRLWMVQQAASHCQTVITNFLLKGDIYMRCLSQGGSTKWWKNAFYKVKWAIYKVDDLNELRASLRGHTMAMSLMLQVLQM